jgi:hypothetical protein
MMAGASLKDCNVRQGAAPDSAGTMGASELISLKYFMSEVSLARIHLLRYQLVAKWRAMFLQACPQYGWVWSYSGPLPHKEGPESGFQVDKLNLLAVG